MNSTDLEEYLSTSTSSYVNDSNVTFTFIEDFQNATVAPLLILVCYFIFILIGFCFNLFLILMLFRCKRDGILSSILQLSVLDAALTFVGITEVWTINNKTWTFSTFFCQFYLGTEVLYNTFVLYCIICINFHIISTFNLHLYETEKNDKNPLTSQSNEDLEYCLVDRSIITNRNVTIDYSKKKSTISIILPSVLIWFVCISLSVPQYTISNTINVNNTIFCTIVDKHQRESLQYLQMIFRIVTPTVLLLLSLMFLFAKFYLSVYSKCFKENILARKTQAIKSLLLFGISVTMLYSVTCIQRQFVYLLHVSSESSQKYVTTFNKFDVYKLPPLQNAGCSQVINLISAMIYYGFSFSRVILCLTILPELNNVSFRLLSNKLKCDSN